MEGQIETEGDEVSGSSLLFSIPEELQLVAVFFVNGPSQLKAWTLRCVVRVVVVSAREPSLRHATGVATRGRHGVMVHGEIGSLGPRRAMGSEHWGRALVVVG